MKKNIILLGILAVLILVLPFLYGKLKQEATQEPAPTVTPEPTITPAPTLEVVEIVIPAPGETATPEPLPTATPDAWPVFPVIDEPVVVETHQPAPPVNPTPIPQVAVPEGAAFVLTINGKNIMIAKNIDEETLEKSPGWLDSSAKPGKEGVCVVYGHRNRNHLLVLKDVSFGDSILVTMPDGKTYTYVIESTEILESNEDLRIPTIEGKHMMLTTCYPFYYTGHAPKKYVVIARLI